MNLFQRLERTLWLGEGAEQPAYGDASKSADDPHGRDLVLFYKYFHGDTGAGFGISH